MTIKTEKEGTPMVDGWEPKRNYQFDVFVLHDFVGRDVYLFSSSFLYLKLE